MLEKFLQKNCRIIITAIIVYISTHFYMISHNWPNPDCMYGFYYNWNQLNVGRWFMKWACLPSTPYYLPWVVGLLCMIYLTIMCLIVIRIFDITTFVGEVLIELSLIAFPAIASTLSYMIFADGYLLGLLLAIISIFLAEKKKIIYTILSCLVLCLSMGIYQSYISVAIILCMGKILLGIVKNEDIVKLAKSYLVMGVGGGILYVLIEKSLLYFTGESLLSYQGMSNVEKLKLEDIVKNIGWMYEEVFEFFKTSIIFNFSNLQTLCVGIAILVALTEYVYMFIRKCLYKDFVALIFLLGIIVALPFGVGTFYLVSHDVEYHMLMQMPWVGLIFLMISINEYFVQSTGVAIKKLYAISCVSVLIIGINFFYITNISYMNISQRWEKDYGLCVRLVDRIEQIDNWNPDMPIYIYGTFLDETLYPKTSIVANDIVGMTGLVEEHIFNTDFHYQQFIKNYLGVTLKLATEEQKKV